LPLLFLSLALFVSIQSTTGRVCSLTKNPMTISGIADSEAFRMLKSSLGKNSWFAVAYNRFWWKHSCKPMSETEFKKRLLDGSPTACAACRKKGLLRAVHPRGARSGNNRRHSITLTYVHPLVRRARFTQGHARPIFADFILFVPIVARAGCRGHGQQSRDELGQGYCGVWRVRPHARSPYDRPPPA
jgi:hypothetical protein